MMIRTLMFSCVLGFSTLLCGSACAADASASDETAKPTTIKTKVEERPSASSIDFAGALELPFNSLTTLGARIEQARRDADPVGLMNAARELAVAEQLSGKKASLSATELRKEAVELARLRGNSAELEAVSLMVHDEKTQKALKQAVQQAKKREAEQAAALEAGERSRLLVGDLVVENHTHHWAIIYVDGHRAGRVAPHGHEHFHVHSHRDQTVLEAHVCGHGHARHNHRHVHTHRPYYHWTIH